jgi:RluA family pseudouridine synthase
MVYQARLWVQQLINLLTNSHFAKTTKNMENILHHSVTQIHNKSHIGVQCSLSNDLESSQCNPENCLVIEKEEEYDKNSDVLENKRKLQEYVEYREKPKKFKLDPAQLRPGFTDERFNETSYYFDNGLRKVYPYYFTFTTYTKGRWVGKTLLEVFGKEFRAHTSDEYKHHIQKGSLTINNERVTPDYVLKHNDLLANVVHRHEVPVVYGTIDILHIDKDIVVVNKPASIPVHPCGRYRHNTIIFLLAKEYNLKDLKTIHRLDRLTSGVLMFGRTQNLARKLEAQIREREVSKQYVCRVEGKFPESVECEEPIEVVSYKIGVCKVSPKGKKCRTSFQLIGYNEKMNTSVVLCKPYSGRMHQIRVHLQYLGYPIKNDPLYNDIIFGPEKGRKGKFGKTDEQLVQDLIIAHNAENWLKTDNNLSLLPKVVNDINNTELLESPRLETNTGHSPKPMFINMTTQTGIDLPDMTYDKNKDSIDPYCQECKINYKDPQPKDLMMYLHALKYSGPDWTYETPMPVWADVNWNEL